jgi:UDP-N-acetylmuramoyl-L-alanyl-D-glutamate--2,6-diaminopimelate ligase
LKLSQLLCAADLTDAVPDREIRSITADIGQVGQGSLYVCHRRDVAQVSRLIKEARAAGAVSVAAVGEPDIRCGDTRRMLSYSVARFYGDPHKKLRVIGVTGTNGKTTVSSMLAHILRQAGRRCELVGTNNCGGYTTPIPEILFPTMARAVEQGCQDFVMEVSSHSLDQSRVAPIRFACGIFTNLTQDHLDYHLSMQRYAKAKEGLFAQSDTAVINADDGYAAQMASACRDVSYYGKAQFGQIQTRSDGVRYRLDGMDITCPTPGLFSVYNSAAAAMAARRLGVAEEDIVRAIGNFRGVDGRMEILQTNTDFRVIIDYAHTPDGLKNVLSTINAFKQGRLIVVFGAGGQRDKGKRAHMFAVCADLADYVVITSDNPRKEDPFSIIKDILAGLNGYTTPFAVLENRRAATDFALREAKPGDIVLLAGKGHERYQLIGDQVLPYDEREIVKEILEQDR